MYIFIPVLKKKKNREKSIYLRRDGPSRHSESSFSEICYLALQYFLLLSLPRSIIISLFVFLSARTASKPETKQPRLQSSSSDTATTHVPVRSADDIVHSSPTEKNKNKEKKKENDIHKT